MLQYQPSSLSNQKPEQFVCVPRCKLKQMLKESIQILYHEWTTSDHNAIRSTY